MASRVSLLVLLLFFAASAVVEAGDTTNDLAVPAGRGRADERSAATTAAKRFLAAVERGQIERVWPGTSILWRATSDAAGWGMLFERLQRELGPVKSRQVIEIGFTNHLSAQLPGRYAIIRFRSEFARGTMDEKLALSLEDRRWKVGGYIYSDKRVR